MAFKPSGDACDVVSDLLLRESKANVSVNAVFVVSAREVACLTVSIFVLSCVEFSWPYTDTPGNIVKNSEIHEKKTTTDLKFDNESYFCNKSELRTKLIKIVRILVFSNLFTIVFHFEMTNITRIM